MSFLSGAAPGTLEQWELEEGQYINRSLSQLDMRARMAVLLSVGLVTGIEISNRMAINVLLPDMQGNVAANSDEISWAITLYNLGFLCSMAFASWMTRVIGARRHLLYSIGFYTIGALGCFLSAHNLTTLLISRTIMGFGGGAFIVRVVILANLMFPGATRIGAVTRLYAVLGIFQIFYPPAQGYIDDQLHWNYAFLLDMPFLAIGAMLIARYVPKGYLFRRDPEKQTDYVGVFSLVASLVCFQVATSRGQRDYWFESNWVGPTLVAGAILFVIFLWWDSRPNNLAPVFHLRVIWRVASIRTSLSVVLVVGAILGGGLYVVPQYLRYVQDYSATQTGGFISCWTGGLMCGLLVALRLVIPRIHGAWTMALGLVMTSAACGLILYIWTPTTPTWLLALAFFAQGFSLGPVLVGASNVATLNAAPADVNDITTTFFFVRQLGNTMGVTAATVLFDQRMTVHSTFLLAQANALDPTTRTTLQTYANLIHRNGGGDVNPALGALQLFQASVITQSRLLSYIDIYFGLAFIALVGLFFLWIGQVRARSEAHHAHFHLL